MEILNRYTKKVIYKSEKEAISETVIEAIQSKFSLSNANLFKADLSNANLSNANLSNANLSNAKLCDANLQNAKITYRGKLVEVKFEEV